MRKIMKNIMKKMSEKINAHLQSFFEIEKLLFGEHVTWLIERS